MDKKVLVAYGSWAGSTAEIAEEIAAALQESGLTAEASPASKVMDLSTYRAVIVGSGIHAGQLHGDVYPFMAMHEAVLEQMPVAYFLVCMGMKEDTAEHRQEVGAYLKKLHDTYPQIKPVDEGYFAGVMDFNKLSWIFRTMMKVMKLEEADYRDPEAIRAWAVGLIEKFI